MAVPPKAISISLGSIAASAMASLKASTSRSPAEVSHLSPNLVHPTPMMATWSLIPFAIFRISSVIPSLPGLLPHGGGAPVVDAHAARNIDQLAPVGHFHRLPYLQAEGIDIDHLHLYPAAAV